MAEKCRYAYRKPGIKALFCKQLKGQKFEYCSTQYFCGVTQRIEANKATPCTLRNKPAVQDK